MTKAIVLAEDPTEEQFHSLRRGLITGSDIGTLLGVNRFSTPYALALEKKGLVPRGETNDAQWLGKQSEPHILSSFTRTMGRPVRPNRSIFINPELPWMGATPDGFTDDPEEGLEAKLSGINSYRDWGEPGTEDIPISYYCQVEWYMAVTDLPRWWVIAQIGTKLQNHPIERNDELITKMIAAAKEFREQYLLTDELPEPGALDVDRVRDLYPVSSAGLLEETPEIRALVELFAAARLEEAVAKSAKNDARAKLEARMGTLEKLTGPDYAIHWRSAKPKTVTDFAAVVHEALNKLPREQATAIQGMVAAHTIQKPGSRAFRPVGELFKGEEEE